MFTKDTTSHIVSSDNQFSFDSLCPCVERPFIDCYCVDITSIKIAHAVEYCGANYENCEIYLRNKVFRNEFSTK